MHSHQDSTVPGNMQKADKVAGAFGASNTVALRTRPAGALRLCYISANLGLSLPSLAQAVAAQG